MLPLLLVEEFRIQRSVGYTLSLTAPRCPRSRYTCVFNANYTFYDARVKLLSALNQRERSIDIFSVVFIIRRRQHYVSDVDSKSSITVSARLFIYALRIINYSRNIPLMIRNVA